MWICSPRPNANGVDLFSETISTVTITKPSQAEPNRTEPNRTIATAHPLLRLCRTYRYLL
ncbi:MAG: hypothetical protein K9K78_03715 [Spirochaetales bacterium]|nr:hypothetical protein [Spirochaetales bacterium]